MRKFYTKTDLIKDVAEATELKKKDVSLVVNEVINILKEQIKSGNSIFLAGLGTIKVKTTKKKKAKAFGREITIPKLRRVKFKLSKELKYV